MFTRALGSITSASPLLVALTVGCGDGRPLEPTNEILPVLSTTPGEIVILSTRGIDAGNTPSNPNSQWLGVSFALTESASHVSLNPFLKVFRVFPRFTGTAYLTDAIGGSATNGNVIAQAPMSIQPGFFGFLPVLSGLTLQPGTYYLLIIATENTVFWPQLTNSVVSTDCNAAYGQGWWTNTGGMNTNFPPASSWMTANMLPQTLQIEITGTCVLEVSVDIKPGSDPNSINCYNDEETITVAIVTTEDFDATTVDHNTVTFEGASETHVNKKSGEPRRHEEDVDGDGDTDLVFHFRIGDTDFDCLSTEGTLTGETFEGQSIAGTDAVRMIGG